jgi:transcriptional regulator with XRE-family HTH domain
LAEQATIAFGRYLKTLRDRRGLSLDQVARLSGTSARPLDKGSLSRFERGRQRLPLSAVIPIGHIYRVGVEVLVERLELDTELDNLGGIATDGMDVDELRRQAGEALQRRSRKWDAYAYLREALHLAETDGTGALELGRIRLNLATVMRSLGKNRLALHELLELEGGGRLDDRLHAIVLDRLSNCHRCLGELDAAEHYADDAVARALDDGERRILAYAQVSRAQVALEQGERRLGIDYLQRAFRSHRESGDSTQAVASSPSFEVDTLLQLSEAYLGGSQLEKAGRAARAAKRLSLEAGLPGGRAYSELMLGELDQRAGRDELALQRWRRSGRLAESIHNRRLGFSAEFYVFRQALERGNPGLARASRKRLERLAPWVPEHMPLLRRFRELAGGPVPAAPRMPPATPTFPAGAAPPPGHA